MPTVPDPKYNRDVTVKVTSVQTLKCSVDALPADHHYIGRPRLGQASALANRWSHRADTAAQFVTDTLAQAIEEFRQWLWLSNVKPALGDGEVTDAMHELLLLAYRAYEGESLTLVCWCAPKPCHGHVIAKAIEWLCANEGENVKQYGDQAWIAEHHDGLEA